MRSSVLVACVLAAAVVIASCSADAGADEQSASPSSTQQSTTSVTVFEWSDATTTTGHSDSSRVVAAEGALAWCTSQLGAFLVALEAGWPSSLPIDPFSRSSGTGDQEMYAVSDARTISADSDEAFFAQVFYFNQWNHAFDDWMNTDPDGFVAACVEAEEKYKDKRISNTPLALNAELAARYALFLEDIRNVTSGTYVESWEDAELVAAGERLCWLFVVAKLDSDRPDEETLQWLSESGTEVVYGHLFDVHPTSEEAFEVYMERWAGPDWQRDFQEFSAALTYDAAHILCPQQGDYLDALVAEAASS